MSQLVVVAAGINFPSVLDTPPVWLHCETAATSFWVGRLQVVIKLHTLLKSWMVSTVFR
jgi:hypothetical protein